MAIEVPQMAKAEQISVSFGEKAGAHGPLGLEELPDAVVLINPRLPGYPIAAASAGFQRLTGRSSEELLGDASSSLLQGVPSVALSRSAQKNFEDFCESSLKPGVTDIAESWHVHPYARKDGSVFNSFVMLGFCRTQLGPYVVMVHLHLCEGIVAPRASAAQSEQWYEQAREAVKHTRQHLASQEVPNKAPADCGKGASVPGTFYSDRLRDRAILFASARSAARREPTELPVGCLLFGSAPMVPAKGKGLQFALRVDDVNDAFRGLPSLGFTRLRPADQPGAYPSAAQAKCLGSSALVGGVGEATARDKEEHFKVGFRKIPESEVASWSVTQEELASRGLPSAKLSIGDVVECRYTCEGSIQFWLNGAKLLDFDIGRPLEDEGYYWPVVDVSYSVSAMSWLGGAAPSAGHGEGFSGSLAQVATLGNLSTFAPTMLSCLEGDEEEECDALSVFSDEEGEEELGDDGCKDLASTSEGESEATAQAQEAVQPSAAAVQAGRSPEGGAAGKPSRALFAYVATAAVVAAALAVSGHGARR